MKRNIDVYQSPQVELITMESPIPLCASNESNGLLNNLGSGSIYSEDFN